MPLPWWKLYNEEFLLETRHLGPAEVGAVVRLKAEQWARGGLPADPAALRRLAGYAPGRAWSASWPLVAPFFPVDPADGLRRNEGLAAQLREVAGFSAAQSQKARKRWESLAPDHAPAPAGDEPRQPAGNADLETVDKKLSPARDPGATGTGRPAELASALAAPPPPDPVPALRRGRLDALWWEIVATMPGDAYALDEARKGIQLLHDKLQRPGTTEDTARDALKAYRQMVDEWKRKNIDAPATAAHFMRLESQARIADRLQGKRPQLQAPTPAGPPAPRHTSTPQESGEWFRQQQEARARAAGLSEGEVRSHIAALRAASGGRTGGSESGGGNPAT
jgi:uncharacterized protein YdaU (DUF1376 family)